MNTDYKDSKYKELTEKIIRIFYPKGAKVEGAPDLRHQGRSRSLILLRVLDNEEDGVSSAFPKGKQNGIF
jgi:hypothetical protein